MVKKVNFILCIFYHNKKKETLKPARGTYRRTKIRMAMDFLLKQCNQEDRVTPQNTETQNTQQQKIQKLN